MVLCLQLSVSPTFWACEELHPIYQAEDVLQQQAEWSSSDEIEPLQGASYDEPEAYVS